MSQFSNWLEKNETPEAQTLTNTLNRDSSWKDSNDLHEIRGILNRLLDNAPEDERKRLNILLDQLYLAFSAEIIRRKQEYFSKESIIFYFSCAFIILIFALIAYIFKINLKAINSTNYDGDITARGLISLTFVIGTIGITLLLTFSILTYEKNDIKDRFQIGKDVLTTLIGVLGTIIGFYFGLHSTEKPSSRAGATSTTSRIASDLVANAQTFRTQLERKRVELERTLNEQVETPIERLLTKVGEVRTSVSSAAQDAENLQRDTQAIVLRLGKPKNELARIEERVRLLTDEVQNAAERTAGLQANIDEVQSRSVEFQNLVAAKGSQVERLAEQTSERFTRLADKLSTLEVDVPNLSLSATGHAKRLASLDAQITTIAQQTEAVSRRIGDLNGDLDMKASLVRGIETKIAGSEEKIRSQAGRIDRLVPAVDDLEAKVGSVMEHTNILASRIADAEEQLRSQVGRIGKIASGLDDLEAKNRRAADRTKAVEADLDKREGQLRELADRINKLFSAADASSQNCQCTPERMPAMEARLQRLEEQLRAEGEEVHKLVLQVNSSDTNCRCGPERIAAVEAKIARIEEQIAHQAESTTNTSSQVKELARDLVAHAKHLVGPPAPPAQSDKPITLTSDQLRTAQKVLVERGLLKKCRPKCTDGKLGPRTEAAVKEYQHGRGETETGYLTSKQFFDLLASP